MRIKFAAFITLAATSLLVVGCAGPERKLGRGLNNMTELLRGGEVRRSFEQTAIFGNTDTAYTTAVIHGMNRAFCRTGVGIWEVLTAPIPNHMHPKDYGPIIRPENPVYPDSYKPN